MPHIPQDIIDEIRDRADLVSIVSQVTAVRQNGRAFWACCPFHKEKTPSFKIDPQRQTYYCFGCKKSGNVFHFVQDMVNTDFVGAVQWLADRLGITIPEEQADGMTVQEQDRRKIWRENCYKLLNDVANWFHSNLSLPEAEAARAYLQSRGLDAAAVQQFRLGYSPNSWDALGRWAERLGYTQEMLLATGLTIQREDSKQPYDRFRGRLTFPIQDELGRVVGFSARVLDAEAKTAKYINSPETDFFQKGKLLYAFHIARQALKSSGKALICEGQLDVIACHRAGLTYATAAQGTAFTEFHARLLKRSTQRVVLSFDADGAGQKATVRTTAILHAQGLAVDIATLPDGEDPDSIFRKGGAHALSTMLETTKPAIPYLFEVFCRQHDRTKPEELSVIVKETLDLIRPISDPIVKAGHCKWLAEQLKIPETIILQELKLMEDSTQSPFAKAVAPQKLQSQPRQAMPVFVMQQVNEQLYQALLELVMHFEELAKKLSENDDAAPLIPDTPLGQAINMVMAQTSEGEWSLAEESIIHSDLAAVPQIGKVLLNPVFSQYLPDANDTQEIRERKKEKVEAAYTDCVNQLLLGDVEQRLAQTLQAMTTAAGEDALRYKQDYLELLKRKNALKKR